MKTLLKLLSLVLCLTLLIGCAAAETVPAAGDVLATLNGQSITWAEVEPYYDTLKVQYADSFNPDSAEDVSLFQALAMGNALTEKLILQKGQEMGLLPLTAEEEAAIIAQADTEFDAALQQYITDMRQDITPESSEEDRAAALAEAEGFYAEAGYPRARVQEGYLRSESLNRVTRSVLADVNVTEADVEAFYQQRLAEDRAAYENDLQAYADYLSQMDMMEQLAAMYGMPNEMTAPFYRPAGYRGIKHILLPVDAELMTAYTDLQARLEEQQHAHEAEGEEASEAAEAAEEAPAAPVTPEDVNQAKAAVLASLADTIQAIYDEINNGADFDALIAAYGVNADGTPSDPGMTREPYMTDGYEVCAYSTSYVPEFVEAAMSITEVGGVSAPYLSSYGVHIAKYVKDVPAGEIPMTDAQRADILNQMRNKKANEVYTNTLQGWLDAATITYTGIVTSYDELIQPFLAAPAEEVPVEEVPVEEVPVEEVPVEDAPAE